MKHAPGITRETRCASTAVTAFLAEQERSQRMPTIPASAALQAMACEATGLDDFGETGFLDGLEVLLDSVRREGQTNAFGAHVLSGHALRILENRLHMRAWLKSHPETERQGLASPVIIVGPHRSGTTRLHRLLALDDRFQYLKAWEGLNPAPRLAQPDFGAQERRREIDAMLNARPRYYPGAAIAHPMHADEAEEETLLLHQSFQSFLSFGFHRAPGFYQWFMQSDKRDAYVSMRTALQAISLSRGTCGKRPWILKCPQHLMSLDVLMSVFPDARLIFTHRDPVSTVGSVMSLMWHYAIQHTDAPVREYIRDTWWDFCKRSAQRCAAQRPHIPADRQLDVRYDDMDRDWRGCMKRIYAFLGMALTEEAEQAMQAWLAESDRRQTHGQHRYAVEDFGLSASQVRRELAWI